VDEPLAGLPVLPFLAHLARRPTYPERSRRERDGHERPRVQQERQIRTHGAREAAREERAGDPPGVPGRFQLRVGLGRPFVADRRGNEGEDGGLGNRESRSEHERENQNDREGVDERERGSSHGLKNARHEKDSHGLAPIDQEAGDRGQQQERRESGHEKRGDDRPGVREVVYLDAEDYQRHLVTEGGQSGR